MGRDVNSQYESRKAVCPVCYALPILFAADLGERRRKCTAAHLLEKITSWFVARCIFSFVLNKQGSGEATNLERSSEYSTSGPNLNSGLCFVLAARVLAQCPDGLTGNAVKVNQLSVSLHGSQKRSNIVQVPIVREWPTMSERLKSAGLSIPITSPSPDCLGRPI